MVNSAYGFYDFRFSKKHKKAYENFIQAKPVQSPWRPIGELDLKKLDKSKAYNLRYCDAMPSILFYSQDAGQWAMDHVLFEADFELTLFQEFMEIPE
jgi:hypothetical protein